MARIANLTISLSAEDRKLQRQLRSARQQWRRYSRQVSRDVSNASKTIARAASIGAAALTGLSGAAVSTATEISRLAKNAGLGAETFQRMAFAWQQAGLSAEDLTAASVTLADQIVELGRGSATQVENFRRLGLSFSQLAELNPADQLNLVVDALRRISNPTEQAALAQQLLSGEGERLGSVFATSAAQMQEFENRIQALGGVLDQGTLDAAENLTNQFTTLTSVITAQFTRGVLENSTAFRDWTALTIVAGNAAIGLGRAISSIATFLVDNRNLVLGLVATYGTLRAVAFSVAAVAAVKSFAGAIVAASGALATLAAASAPMLALWAGVVVAAGALGFAVYTAIQRMDQLRNVVLTNMTVIRDAFTNSLGAVQSAWERVIPLIQSLVLDFVITAVDAIGSLTETIGAGDLLGTEDTLRGLIRLRETYVEVYDEATARQSRFAAAARDSFNRIGEGTGQVFTGILDDLQRDIQDLGSTLGESIINGGGEALEFLNNAYGDLFNALGLDLDALFDDLKLGLEAGVEAGGKDGAEKLVERMRAAFKEIEANAAKSIENGISLSQALSGSALPPSLALELRTAPVNQADPLSESIDIARDFFDGFRSGLLQALDGGNFGDVATAIGQAIRRGLAERAADQITNYVEDLFNNIFDAIQNSARQSQGGGGFTGFIRGLLGFQQGGVVPGLGNEPRLIVAHAGEVVLNKQQQAALLSGRTGSTYVNVYGAQGAVVEESTTDDGDQLIDVMVGGSLNRMGRDGQLDGLFTGFGGRRALTAR